MGFLHAFEGAQALSSDEGESGARLFTISVSVSAHPGRLVHKRLPDFQVAELRSLLPSGTAVDIRPVEDCIGSLYPVERRYISRAVDKRKREFASGRACARAALEQLGVEARAIPVGPNREPIWPEGYVGSISHDSGMCVAIAKRAQGLKGLGLDLATTERLSDELKDMICVPEELADATIAGNADVDGFKLIFSAKEALYKALFPVLHRFVDFREVRIKLDEDRSRWRPLFLSADLGDTCGKAIEGRLLVSERFVVATAWWSGNPE